MSNSRRDFCRTMQRCLADERELASFKRPMAGFCRRTDRELLVDIRRECQVVSQAERNACIRDLVRFRGTRDYCNYQMQRRVQGVTNVLNVSNPNPNSNSNPSIRRRRRGGGLLSGLVLLFLLRGITRRRRRRFF